MCETNLLLAKINVSRVVTVFNFTDYNKPYNEINIIYLIQVITKTCGVIYHWNERG